MNRTYKPNQPTTAATRDASFGEWLELDNDIHLSRGDLMLAVPCRALGGLSEDGPMEAYERLLQLVETHALFPCSVLHTGARSLQQHFSFDD